MSLSDFARWLGTREPVREIFSELGQGTRWSSVAPEARPILLAGLWHSHSSVGFKGLIVTTTYERAIQWQARLGLCGIPTEKIRIMPSGQNSLFEDSAPESIALSDRIGAMRALISDEPGIVIATAAAALERTLPLDDLKSAFVKIEKVKDFDLDATIDLLERIGYEKGEPVRVPGQYSRRGGILDIFPMGSDRPVRIELFGDEVESLRFFDPTTQRSTGDVESLEISPSRETLLPALGSDVIELVERSLELECSRLSSENADRLRELVEGDVRSLRNRIFFDRLDLYRPLLHSESGCAIDLLPETGLLILDEPHELEAAASRTEDELSQALGHRCTRGEILHSTANDYMLPPEHLGSSERSLALVAGSAPSWYPAGPDHAIGAVSMAGYRGQPELLTKSLKDWLADQMVVGISTDQPMRAKAVFSQVQMFTLLRK